MSDYLYSIAVFCGSNSGNKPIYTQAAKQLATDLVHHQLRLIFGGGNVGLMGVISNTTLDLGGKVKGVIPKFLQAKEGKHSRVKDLVVTEDMHARKKILYNEADAFLIMPGGIGTFDEFFEILTWKQLDLHQKPIIIVNINQWADPIHNQLRQTVEEGFSNTSLLNLFEIMPDVPTTMQRLKALLKF